MVFEPAISPQEWSRPSGVLPAEAKDHPAHIPQDVAGSSRRSPAISATSNREKALPSPHIPAYCP
jgi:hypothetical protein